VYPSQALLLAVNSQGTRNEFSGTTGQEQDHQVPRLEDKLQHANRHSLADEKSVMPPDDSGINPLSPGNGEELNPLGAKRLQGGRLF
jgi:hypothetical protein